MKAAHILDIYQSTEFSLIEGDCDRLVAHAVMAECGSLDSSDDDTTWELHRMDCDGQTVYKPEPGVSYQIVSYQTVLGERQLTARIYGRIGDDDSVEVPQTFAPSV